MSPAQWTPERFAKIKKQVRADTQRYHARRRKEILLALANMRDDGCAHFRRKLYFPNDPILKDSKTIWEYRNQLRKLWRREPDWNIFLHHWVCICRERHLPTWVVPGWADGTQSVEPNFMVFPLALAIAAGEWMPKMVVCANPECPSPYFLKSRKTQRFCDRPACIACGQREHKLNWWRRVGAKRRASKANPIRRKDRRERTHG